MSDLDVCELAIDRIGDRAEGQITVIRGPSALTRFANSFIHQNVAEERVAVSLIVSLDGRAANFSSTRTDAESITDLVGRTIAAAVLRPADPHWPGMAPPAPTVPVDHFDAATADADPGARAKIVERFVAAGGGLGAAGFCQTEGTHVAYANTAGQCCVGSSTHAIIDGIHQTPRSAGTAHQMSARIADLDPTTAGAEAASKARQGLDAVDLKPGRYEVVLEPNAVATLVVFLAVYAFNARAAVEQRTFLELGSQQFDPLITLVDDATRPQALGLAFDAEGTPKRPVSLIDRGISRSFTHDRRTAGQMGSASTGHAVPGLGSFGAIPTNMFLEPGSQSRSQMIESIERGLLVTEFNYCRVLDPRTMAVTGLTRNGTFLIENGEIAHPVTNLRFTQSFASALAPGAVLGVEDTARFADSEFGPGFAHVPSLRLAEWNFTGGAEG